MPGGKWQAAHACAQTSYPENRAERHSPFSPERREQGGAILLEQAFTLDRLASGESARIARLTGTGAMQSRLCDLGFTENSRVTCLFPSAFGDPRAYRIRDTVVALRSGDARTVLCLAEGGKK